MQLWPRCVSRASCKTQPLTRPNHAQRVRCSSDLHNIVREEFAAHRYNRRLQNVRSAGNNSHEYHTAHRPRPQTSNRVWTGTSPSRARRITQEKGDPITSRPCIPRGARVITSSAIRNQQQTAPATENEDEDHSQEPVAAPDSRQQGSVVTTGSSHGGATQGSGHSIKNQGPDNARASASASKKGLYRRPPLAITASVDGAHMASLLKTMRDARKLGLPDSSQALTAEPEGFNLSETLVPPRRALSQVSAALKASFNELKKLPMFRHRMAERVRLPMMAKDTYESLMQRLDEADVLIIAGQTGCGKTTQVPQIILDYAIHRGVGAFCKIICTQPRRISATSIAKRVASERCEPLGRSVGYHVRFDKRGPSQEGSILYCTNGVLLKQLQEDPEYYMTRMSHIIVDEVHERSLATDHLLTLFKVLMHQRKAKGQSFPKLILMSATIDTKVFVDYYHQPSSTTATEAGGQLLETRFLDVEGRMYPVESKFLEDFLPQLQAETDPAVMHLLQSTGEHADRDTKPYIEAELEFAANPSTRATKVDDSEVDADDAEEVSDEAIEVVEPADLAETLSPTGLAAAAVAHVAKNTKSGDILVFVPGFMEIDRISELLTERKPLGLNVEGGDFKLFKLHSTLGELNDEVFKPVLPGCRRIVVSTNIAESSITLPAVEHVIDMGKVRYYTHDHASGDREYAAKWISKASSKQRLGRAGRVQPGTYYGLFTRNRYESFEDHVVPEMARISIVGTCLEAAALKASSDVQTFLNKCPTPPKPEAVKAALETLKDLGAITERQELTALGRVLSLVPLQPDEGKAVLLGVLFKCLEPMLIMACYDASTPLINHPTQRRVMSATRRVYAGKSESDLLSVVNAFKVYDAALLRGDREELQTLASEHYIKPIVHQEIRMLTKQIYEHLAYAELVPQIPDPQGHLFSQIPSYLNTNAENVALLKALLMSTLTPNLAVCRRQSGREWTTRGNEKALMEPRTVNVTSSKVALEEYGRIREAGDMIAYSSRRDMQEDKYPWILGGSMITPLTAVLFADTAERLGDRIRLDGIVDVAFEVKNNALKLDGKTATTLLLEARKAIDRFSNAAFEDLRYSNFKGRLGKSYGIEQQGSEEQAVSTKHRTDFTNTIMRNAELRDTFVSGIADVLKAEDDALMEVFERQKAEFEITKQEEAKKASEEKDENINAARVANSPNSKKSAKKSPALVAKNDVGAGVNAGIESSPPLVSQTQIGHADLSSATL